MGIGTTIAASARSLGLIRSAVSNVEDRLKAMEAEYETADPIRASVLREQIRIVSEERLASRELLHEAQARSDERAMAFRAREEAAMHNFGKISSAAREAARRVDIALAEACAAIDEVEQLCEPLNFTLLPSGCLARYTGSATIMSAVRAAFASRITRAEQMMESVPFSKSIDWMIGTVARDNIAQVKRNHAERDRLQRAKDAGQFKEEVR